MALEPTLDLYFFTSTGAIGRALGVGDTTFGTTDGQAFGVTAYDMAVADFNGDGVPDAAVGMQGDNGTIWFWFGDGAIVGAIELGITPNAMASGDFDGDGDIDIVIGGTNPGPSRILFNTGNGFLLDKGPIVNAVNPNTIVDIEVADVDGDNDLDYVTLFTNGLAVYRNDGAGVMTPTTVADVPTFSNRVMKLVDIDGDGDQDVVTAEGGGRITTFVNNGTGAFARTQEVLTPFGVDVADDMAVGDIDGDGDADIVAVHTDEDSAIVLVNDGTGTFTVDVTTYATRTTPSAISAGDIDGDGDLDFIIAREAGAGVTLLLNEGDGTFVAEDRDVGLASVQGIAFAQINEIIEGDGRYARQSQR